METTKHFEQRMTERGITWSQVYETLQNVRKSKRGSNSTGKTIELHGPEVVVVIDPVLKKFVTLYKRY